MIRERRFAAAATLALALALTTACAPDPAPTPSPTGFASQEEAFAAAEATVRGYFDASNQVDLADPRTYEALFALTTGEQNAFDRKRYSEYNAEGLSMRGASEVLSVTPVSWDPTEGIAVVDACVDVSSVEISRRDGSSAISPDRPDQQSLEVILHDEKNAFLIESISGGGRESCE